MAHIGLLPSCVYSLDLCTSFNISSVYSPFSDGVGLPLHNIPSSGVLMKSIGAEFLQRLIQGILFSYKVIGRRGMYGYWTSLLPDTSSQVLPSPTLFTSLLKESSQRVCHYAYRIISIFPCFHISHNYLRGFLGAPGNIKCVMCFI